MNEKSTYPTENSFDPNSSDFSDKINELRDLLSRITNNNDPSDSQTKFHNFYEKTLPNIWKNIITAYKMGKQPRHILDNFVPVFFSFLYYTNFSSKLLNSILFCFNDAPMPTPVSLKIYELNKKEIEEILDNVSESSISSKYSGNSFVEVVVVKSMVTTKFFRLIYDKIINKSLTIVQFDSIAKIVRYIYQSFTKKYMSAVISFLIEASISIVYKQKNDSHNLSQFVSFFAPFAPHYSDKIYDFFCQIMMTGNSQLRAIREMKNVINSNGLCNSAQIIKDAFLNLIEISTDANQLASANTLKSISEFISDELATRVEFTDEELIKMLNQKSFSERNILLRKLLLSIERPLDMFAEYFYNFDLYDPDIFCILIESVTNEELAESLFHKLIEDKNLMKYDLSNIRISERIKRYIDTSDIGRLKELSDFIFNAPRLDLTSHILKLIKFASEDPNLISLLTEFRDLPRIFSVKPFVALFDTYLDLEKDNNDSARMFLKLLEEWIEGASNSFSLSDLFKRLEKINYQKLSDDFPSLIDVLIKKNENVKLTNDLLMKILKDSVPPRHAMWLASQLSETFGEVIESINAIVQILISQLNSSKYICALFLIIALARHEADFYRIGESFGFTQKFSIMNDNNKHHYLTISFHPYQTTTRIYAEIAKKCSKKINAYSLKSSDGSQEKTIPNNSPLQMINFNTLQAMCLKVVEVDDDASKVRAVEPLFLETLRNNVETLWGFITDEKINEVVFELLTLFSPFKNIQKSLNVTHPLQKILVGEFVNPLDYSNSVRVFPTALRVAVNSHQELCSEKLEPIVQSLLNSSFDQVGLAYACNSLLSLKKKVSFSMSTLRRGLIENPSQMFRETIGQMVSTDTDKDVMISLVSSTKSKQNRSNSRQFFDCIRSFKLPAETFTPFYNDLDQYEISHYSDNDDTFISLLELIPVDEKTVELTIERLFSPPTCRNMFKPFIHTLDSWNAAFKFLMTPLALPFLKQLLSQLRIPSSTSTPLSDDFTYKGRNGIHNLGTTCYVNALLQVLNAVEPMALGIISCESHNSQFACELRNILAQLRFVRGTVLSTSQFVETMLNFENNVQQDVMEFFEEDLINKLNSDLIEVLHGKMNRSIRSGNQVLSQYEENFYILSLPTDCLDRLDASFEKLFKDEPTMYTVEGSSEKVQAYHHAAIVKWPDCLAIHLQRWVFQNITPTKLVHYFGFPVELNPNELNCSEGTVKCDFKYTLSGVVVHQGTAEQGHYYAIVEGEDKEWYLCNDSNIQYFDLKELTSFAFGLAESALDEEISTGYLLFYRREDLPSVSMKIPEDLEAHLNAMNIESWPSTIFRSPNFLGFVYNLLKRDTKSPDVIYVGLHVLFKIATCEEEEFEKWCKLFKKHVFPNSKNASLFFDFIDISLNSSLMGLFNLSDRLIDELSQLIKEAMFKSLDSIKPITTIMKYLDYKNQKKSILTLVFELIEIMCNESDVNWTENIQTLQSMFVYLTCPISKDLFRLVGSLHMSVFNSLMGIYAAMMAESGVNRAILDVFDVINLNKVEQSAKKSENFKILLKLVHEQRPDAIVNLGEASQKTRNTLSQYFALPKASAARKASDDGELADDITPRYSLTDFGAMMFASIENIRVRYSQKLKELVGYNNDVANYLDSKVLNEGLPMPVHSEESTYPTIVLGFVNQFLRLLENGKEATVYEYVDLLLTTSRIAPITIGMCHHFIFDAIKFSQIPTILKKLVEILRNVYAAIPSMSEAITDDDLSIISEINVASDASVELLVILGARANHSRLSAACVEYYMGNCIDGHGQVLIKMLKEGLQPPRFEVRQVPTQASQLIIANCLWDAWNDDQKADLALYIKKALEIAEPAKLFMLTRPVAVAAENLKNT